MSVLATAASEQLESVKIEHWRKVSLAHVGVVVNFVPFPLSSRRARGCAAPSYAVNSKHASPNEKPVKEAASSPELADRRRRGSRASGCWLSLGYRRGADFRVPFLTHCSTSLRLPAHLRTCSKPWEMRSAVSEQYANGHRAYPRPSIEEMGEFYQPSSCACEFKKIPAVLVKPCAMIVSTVLRPLLRLSGLPARAQAAIEATARAKRTSPGRPLTVRRARTSLRRRSSSKVAAGKDGARRARACNIPQRVHRRPKIARLKR